MAIKEWCITCAARRVDLRSDRFRFGADIPPRMCPVAGPLSA